MVQKIWGFIKVLFKWSFFRWDHLAVCLMMVLIGWLLVLITSKISIFDPVSAAFDDFSMTDVYFEIQRNGSAKYDDNIFIVDMTELNSRDSIAQVITNIKSCHPKVLGVDLIFERPSSNQMEDFSLVSAINSGDCPQILSCKLREYKEESKSFNNCLYSFFSESGDFKWGYTNYLQKRMGGITRETSQRQNLNDSVIYSFPYLLASYYTGKQPSEEAINEREIFYANIKFHVVKGTEVLQHEDELKNKLVILGAITEEADMHISPIGKISGAEVVAYSILSYMKHDKITKMSRWSSLLLTFILCYLGVWMGYKIERWNSVFFAILAKIFNFGLGVILIGITLYVFVTSDYYIDLLFPLLGLTLVEDVRQLYAGIIRWAVKKKKIAFLKSSLYAEV